MIRHVVVWNLHRAEDAPRVKALLESCAKVVPGITEFDVGIRGAGMAGDAEVVLVSTYADAAALDAYQNHPHHKEVAAQIGTLRSARHGVDYEFSGAAT